MRESHLHLNFHAVRLLCPVCLSRTCVCRPVESVRDYRRLHIAELFWGLDTSDITQGTRSDSMSTARTKTRYFTAVGRILSVICWQLIHRCCTLRLSMTRLLNEFTLCWKREYFSYNSIRRGEKWLLLTQHRSLLSYTFFWLTSSKVIATVCFLIKISGNIVFSRPLNASLQQGETEIQYCIPSCLLEPSPFLFFCS